MYIHYPNFDQFIDVCKVVQNICDFAINPKTLFYWNDDNNTTKIKGEEFSTESIEIFKDLKKCIESFWANMVPYCRKKGAIEFSLADIYLCQIESDRENLLKLLDSCLKIKEANRYFIFRYNIFHSDKNFPNLDEPRDVVDGLDRGNICPRTIYSIIEIFKNLLK